MKATELLRILRSKGCAEVRKGKGSHVRWQCGACLVTIPIHKGDELGRGLLAAIERQLAPCLGPGWLKPLEVKRT